MVKLRQLIRDLPHLLLLSLTFVAALPTIVNGETQLPPPLTPTNFKETVGKGYWFIEHFSPHCWHCRNFLPTWTKLYEMNENGKHPGMHMAQVDCAVNGDLCNDNGVKGYPTLQMWQDGKYIGKFDGMRELDLLTEYLDKYAPSSAAKKDTPPLTTADTPAHIAPTLNTNGEVLDLTGAIFEKTLEQGPAFVKFYAPWCGHCKKLAPIWKSLATALQDKLTVAEVNCEVEKTLCASQGIEGYPSLVYYTAGSKTDYQGGRKLDQLTAFAIKARSDSTEAITAEEVEHYVQKQEIVYTLLHSDPAVLKTLLPLFSTLLGEPKVFTVAGASPDLFASYGLAKSTAFALIAFKDHQFKTPASIYHSSSSALSAENKAAISSWLFAHRLPTTVELTRDTFQSVMNAKHAPLVVIAPVTKDTKDLVKEKFLEISGNWRIRTKGTGRVVGKDGKEREVIFAWMDVERWKDWMSSMYGLGAPNSASVEHLDIVVADHQSLVYYNADESGAPLRLSSMDSLFTGLEGIANERIGSIHSENLLERGVRFLNGVITGLEGYVTSHPFKTVAFFGVFMIALGFFLRQYVLSDIEEEREHLTKKGDRLD